MGKAKGWVLGKAQQIRGVAAPVIVLAAGLLFVGGQTTAQAANKPAQNPQTQAELMERMRAAQQTMNRLTPEQRKMMEQMGIVIPGQNPLAALPESAVGQAMQSGFGPVPRRDAARIDAIPRTPLTDAGMAAYLDATHRHVIARIKPDPRTLGDKVFNKLKGEGRPPASIGNSAAGLWAMGRPEIALYVMGKALSLDPANSDNQSNYAAMLAMSGGEPLAVPLLDKLLRKFPRNSTLLNNLGQAWFNLGDLSQADKFLDETLRIYALHPQANFTKSFIEESRGNKEKALELAKKAVRYSLSTDKENRLRKLGYKLTGNDIRELAKPDPDPLGLSNFRHPAFPKSAEEEIKLRDEWSAYDAEVKARVIELGNKLRAVKPLDKAMANAMAAQNFYTGGKAAPAQAGKSTETVLPLARRARLKLALAEKDGGMKFRLDKALNDLKAHHTAMRPLHAAYFKSYQMLDDKSATQTGEGQANKDFCAEFSALASEYLAQWNAGHEPLFDTYLHQLSLKLNEELYWMQFTKSPEDFEAAKIQYQTKWLAALVSVPYEEIGGVRTVKNCFDEQPNLKPSGGKLADFNDIHCAYHSELDLVLGTIRSDCNKMTTQLGVGFVKLGLTQDMDKETFSDQFVGCSVEVTAGKGADVELGPLSVGVGAEVGLGIEIGRNGVQDVYLTGSVGAGVETNAMGHLADKGSPASMGGLGVGDAKVLGVGTGGRISLISGRGGMDGVSASILE